MSTIVNIPSNVSNDNPVTLPIAIAAGAYTATLTLKGQGFVVSVVSDGSEIEIDNLLQASTTHTLKIYESDGETLLDDTIYSIRTEAVYNSSVNGVQTIETTTSDAQYQITNSAFIGASKILVFVEDKFNGDWGKSDPNSDTITFTNRFDGEYRLSITIFK